MPIADVLRALRTRWKLVLAGVLIGLIAAGAVLLLVPPTYTARNTLHVSVLPGATNSTPFENAQLSQQTIKSYLPLVTGDRVLTDAAARLTPPRSAGDIAGHVTAASPVDSVLIDIDATGRSPQEAAQLANAVGDVVAEVAGKIEQQVLPNGPPLVQLAVIQSATESAAAPTLPRTVVLALGLLAGLVVGCGGALGRHAHDPAVRSADEVRAASGIPLLGRIPADRIAHRERIAVLADVNSPLAEAYRGLRTAVRFHCADRRRKVVMVTSPCGQDGRSSIVMNLAAVMSSGGARVIVVDADLVGSPARELPDAVGLSSVLTGAVRIEQAIHHDGAGFDLLRSGPASSYARELLGRRGTATLAAQLRDRYDVVLVDTPPLLAVTDAAELAGVTEGVVLVCREGVTRRDQIDEAVDALRSVGAPMLGAVLTRSSARTHGDTRRARRRRAGAVPEPAAPVPAQARPARLDTHPAEARPQPAPDQPGIPQTTSAPRS